MQHARHNSRGIALLLVLTVIAVASLIGFALLSSASLQVQVSGNAGRSMSAEYLAESGVQAAMFYLQYPSKMPASWGSKAGYVMKAANQAVDPGASGTFDLEVVQTAQPDVYTIRATGRSAGSPITRSVEAQALVARAKPTFAGGFAGPISIPRGYTFDGPVQSTATVQLVGGLVTGAITQNVAANSYPVPTSATVNWYGAFVAGGQYRMPDGTLGTPQAITTANITAAPTALASNPGRVFYRDGDLDIEGTGMNFNGTLLVRGVLRIRLSGGGVVTITPQPTFPALVVGSNLRMYFTPTTTLRINGLAWLGGDVTWQSALNSNIEVNGALLVGSTSPVLSTPPTGSSAVVNYVPANVYVPDLTTTPQPAAGVKVLSWK